MVEIDYWLRQARYRAKKHQVESTLTKPEVETVLDDFQHVCAYCGEPATALDTPIPFAEGAPNVQANVLPICQTCKCKKRSRTVCWMHETGVISTNIYVKVVEAMLARNGSDTIRTTLRKILGI